MGPFPCGLKRSPALPGEQEVRTGRDSPCRGPGRRACGSFKNLLEGQRMGRSRTESGRPRQPSRVKYTLGLASKSGEQGALAGSRAQDGAGAHFLAPRNTPDHSLNPHTGVGCYRALNSLIAVRCLPQDLSLEFFLSILL